MLHQHTLDKLHILRLTGMAVAFEQQLAQPSFQELSFEERFALLLDQELLYRDNRRLARLLKAARLRVGACVEGEKCCAQHLSCYVFSKLMLRQPRRGELEGIWAPVAAT